MRFLQYDQAALDRQYDQRVWAANAAEVVKRYTEDSERVRKVLGEPRAFTYGPTAAETLDLYPTQQASAPIHVFIHGGAWRLLSKRDSAFAAENFVRAGAHFIAIDFALLPAVTLTEMVDQVRRAVGWVYRHAATFGGSADRLHISGHSSGGHLAACVAVTDWATYGLPSDVVKSTICASGMYDLLPVRLSARNDYVKLDAEAEHSLSPIRHLSHLRSPVFVAYGSLESDEFKRQSRTFAEALGPKLAAPTEVYEGLNHYEVAETLADGSARLGRTALDLMGLK
jgi:arylformamidase